jgi:hypothetical protein
VVPRGGARLLPPRQVYLVFRKALTSLPEERFSTVPAGNPHGPHLWYCPMRAPLASAYSCSAALQRADSFQAGAARHPAQDVIAFMLLHSCI